MKKTLRTLLAAALLAMSGAAQAQTTFNFKDIYEGSVIEGKNVLYLMNKEAGEGVQAVGDVTMTIVPGNYSSAPAYQKFTGDADKANACIRLYGSKKDDANPEGSTITFKHSKDKMVQIVFTATTAEPGAAILKPSCGDVKLDRKTKNVTWTGNAKEVTFSVCRTGANTAVVRFSDIKVYTSDQVK